MVVKDTSKVKCIECEYFYVTWDKFYPRGCKFFGFKSRSYPEIDVKKNSMKECQSFKIKTDKSKKGI